jgi:Icc-related predicted phosphoesterase
MYTQEEATKMLAAFPRVDVMLTHCPPYGINDDPSEVAHTGYRGLLDYIEREQPSYLLHGHTYPSESKLVKQHLGTKIEYVFGEKVLTLS